MRSKKGMSPLIATVLLIAFAVALGAMIMNWSTDVQPIESDSVSVDAANNPCNDVKIELSEVFGKQIFCSAEEGIRFNVVNTGYREVSGLQMRIVDEQLREIKTDLPASRLAIGGTFEHQFPFKVQGKVHVEIVPYVIANGVPQYCLQKRIVSDNLPVCG